MRWPLWPLRRLQAATDRTRPRPTPRRGAAAVGLASARGRAGREQVRPWCTRLPEVRALTPVRDSIEKRAPLPDPRDVFLCHAWGRPGRGRQGTARSPRNARCLGLVQREGRSPSARRCSAKSTRDLRSRESDRAGDPCAAAPPPRRGHRRQGAIGTLARDLLVPVVHGTTYEALREVSPLLGSRSGLNTAEDTMANVAAKLAELVAL